MELFVKAGFPGELVDKDVVVQFLQFAFPLYQFIILTVVGCFVGGGVDC